MSKEDRLCVIEGVWGVAKDGALENGYALGWWSDGEVGLLVGQCSAEDLARETDIEVRIAHEEAAKLHGCSRAGEAYVWSTSKQAAAVLRTIKAQVKAAQAKRSLPKWAEQALAAGWKPPRGWKP